jgi:hypothetical protein
MALEGDIDSLVLVNLRTQGPCAVRRTKQMVAQLQIESGLYSSPDG